MGVRKYESRFFSPACGQCLRARIKSPMTSIAEPAAASINDGGDDNKPPAAAAVSCVLLSVCHCFATADDDGELDLCGLESF